MYYVVLFAPGLHYTPQSQSHNQRAVQGTNIDGQALAR